MTRKGHVSRRRVSTTSGNQGKLKDIFPVREKSGKLAIFKKIREKSGNFDQPIFFIFYAFSCVFRLCPLKCTFGQLWLDNKVSNFGCGCIQMAAFC